MDEKFMPNKIKEKLPLFYNYIRCVQISKNVERVNLSYYDNRFRKFRNPKYINFCNSRIID